MRLVIKDDTIGGETKNSFDIETNQEYLTVEQLIKLRIYEEVGRYNEKQPEYFNSLIQPTNAESTLNGYRLIEKRKLDPEKQYYLALHAFAQNGYFIIINNKQVDSLEQKVELKENMELHFIKLTPLVGG